MTAYPAPTASLPRIQPVVFTLACLGLLAIAAKAAAEGGAHLAWTTGIGALAGLVLYHAAFGFTAAWRRFAEERRGAGLRAQAVLIVLTSALSFPLMAFGREIGLPTGGFVAPFGPVAALGAFLFGIGMQWAGGCGSGTLFTAGGGSSRMVLALLAFIAGSLLATLNLHDWREIPSLPATSLVRSLGVLPAFTLTAGVFVAVAVLSLRWERNRHGQTESLIRPRPDPATNAERPIGWLRGPWPPLAGAIGLAIVSIATLLVLGRPWGITSAFALWGAKLAYGLGVPVAEIPYWTHAMGAVTRSVFADATSVMNFAIMLGAMAAAALAGRWAPVARIGWKPALTAIIGGLLMGYGARLAHGCNIGAFLGGIISGSLHGWGWLLFGWLGSVCGTKLRNKLSL